jgi:hypothetical protein
MAACLHFCDASSSETMQLTVAASIPRFLPLLINIYASLDLIRAIRSKNVLATDFEVSRTFKSSLINSFNGFSSLSATLMEHRLLFYSSA